MVVKRVPSRTSLLKQIHVPACFSPWAFPSSYGFKVVLQFKHIVFAVELFGNFPTQWGNVNLLDPKLSVKMTLSCSAQTHFRPARKLSCKLSLFSLCVHKQPGLRLEYRSTQPLLLGQSKYFHLELPCSAPKLECGATATLGISNFTSPPTPSSSQFPYQKGAVQKAPCLAEPTTK